MYNYCDQNFKLQKNTSLDVPNIKYMVVHNVSEKDKVETKKK